MARPRKMTAERLERAAYHYLQRFAASRARFREVLEQKVRRLRPDRAPPSAEEQAWIDSIEQKCLRLGLLDDRRYAEMKARTLLRRGQPPRRVAQWLRARGVGAADIESALAALAEETGGDEMTACTAALNFARRRRFGPYRTRPLDADRRQREIAAMMRAGFSYGLVRMIVDAVDDEAFEIDAGAPTALPDDDEG